MLSADVVMVAGLSFVVWQWLVVLAFCVVCYFLFGGVYVVT